LTASSRGKFAGEEVRLMEHDHLIGQVQHRARLSSHGEAEVAVRATLQTLEERISGGAYQNLIAQLPQGIGEYRDASDIDRRRTGERFGLDEFLEVDARASVSRKQRFMLAACSKSLRRPPQAQPRLTSSSSYLTSSAPI
jgi:uncharacterized protein (DUF2267 family)